MRRAQVVRRRHQVAGRAGLSRRRMAAATPRVSTPPAPNTSGSACGSVRMASIMSIFSGRLSRLPSPVEPNRTRPGDAGVAIVAGQRLGGLAIHVSGAHGRDHGQPDAFEDGAGGHVHGSVPPRGTGQQHRAEFGARQAGHDSMHDGVDLVASALQLDGGLAMLVIDRQHVDADARAQRPMQRQPQVQRVQAVDPIVSDTSAGAWRGGIRDAGLKTGEAARACRGIMAWGRAKPENVFPGYRLGEDDAST